MKLRSSALYLARSAVVAALYAALTFLWPLSIGPIQCRLSEALCVLPYLMPAAVPGLFVGCLVGNLLSGAIPLDVIFGSLATLLAAALTYWIGKRKLPAFLAPLPGVVVNALVVGALLTYAYEYGLSYPVAILQVGGGQAISCYVLGLPLLYLLQKNPRMYGEKPKI